MDPETEQKRGEPCFGAFGELSLIIKMRRYYQSRADLGTSGCSWLVSDPVRELDHPPEVYSRWDLLGTFWQAILFLRQEEQIARYIDATIKSLT